MTNLEFNTMFNFAEIILTLEMDEDVVVTMKPINDGNELIRFEVKCVSRKNKYTCSRIFFVEDILLEDDYEEYFGKRVAALIEKCKRHEN